MITKTYTNLTKEDFYRLYFNLVNVLQPSKKLSEKEIDLLTEFLLLEGDKFKHARFAARAKKKVTDTMLSKYDRNISNQYMVMILSNLEKKGYIEKDEDGIKYFNKKHQIVVDKILKEKNYTDIVFKLNVQ
jgi:DNA-binding MarR family transcriptional regulator